MAEEITIDNELMVAAMTEMVKKNQIILDLTAENIALKRRLELANEANKVLREGVEL
jgi:hypothetical protein